MSASTFYPTSLLALTLVAASALASGYVGGGSFVVKTQASTLVDDGAVVCQGTAGDGIGGGCLPFGGADGAFVGVRDDVAGDAVAFQVCIDNDGDGVCGGPVRDFRCADQIFFSHADGGRFFNPLGPLPTSFQRGCEAGAGFAGYVVILCTGTHEDAKTGAHEHPATTGAIHPATDGSGYGDFCGGASGGAAPSPTVAKAYRVV